MDLPSAARLVASAVAAWPSELEAVLFGTDEPEEVAGLVAVACEDALGVGPVAMIAYRRGVGVVAGLELEDGRRVAMKVHRPELVGARLEGVRAVQAHLARHGLPAPRPLGEVVPVADALATVEEWVDDGAAPNAHDPAIRETLARELHRFVVTATPLVDEVELPPMQPRSGPYPPPHDLRFDLTLGGGEWIDEIAIRAHETLATTDLPDAIGHLDWQSGNVRFAGGSLVGILDWDSVGRAPEAAIVGANATGFTADWDLEGGDPYPSPDEVVAFVASYETARGASFNDDERVILDAALRYRLAYVARCEHSDEAITTLGLAHDRGYRSLLRAIAGRGP